MSGSEEFCQKHFLCKAPCSEMLSEDIGSLGTSEYGLIGKFKGTLDTKLELKVFML